MNKTIYIANANEEERLSLVKWFQSHPQFSVCGASGNGVTAIREIIMKKPDLVLTDLALQETDGYTLISEVTENLEETSVFVLSALTNDAFITKATALGAKYYMLKPISFEVLSERLLSDDFRPRGRVIRNKSLEEKITNVFISVGIPAHIKGYQFLREAIKMAIEKPDIVNSITKKLYPTIAERYETTSSKVERAIRHAIEVAWNKGRIDSINNLFGIKVYSANDKPTNGEFIALVADKMLIEGV